MKTTAISLPDDTFKQASQCARDLGISRSEFFGRAARHYLDELDEESITHQIDTALDHLDAPDESTAHAVTAGHRILAGVDDEMVIERARETSPSLRSVW